MKSTPLEKYMEGSNDGDDTTLNILIGGILTTLPKMDWAWAATGNANAMVSIKRITAQVTLALTLMAFTALNLVLRQ
ncbi:hypothetical protein JCM14467A_01250 [Vulcanisaeta sp. JCM 14467]